jgi:hypothetical protein
METAYTLVENTDVAHLQWLTTHSSHHLTSEWITQHKSDTFLSTHCHLTAANIRTKSGLGEEWNEIEGVTSFHEVQLLTPIFQITISQDFHSITIWGEYVIQSYYSLYKPRVIPLTQAFIQAINGINNDNNYYLVTGAKKPIDGDYEDLFVSYFVPPGTIINN